MMIVPAGSLVRYSTSWRRNCGGSSFVSPPPADIPAAEYWREGRPSVARHPHSRAGAARCRKDARRLPAASQAETGRHQAPSIRPAGPAQSSAVAAPRRRTGRRHRLMRHSRLRGRSRHDVGRRGGAAIRGGQRLGLNGGATRPDRLLRPVYPRAAG